MTTPLGSTTAGTNFPGQRPTGPVATPNPAPGGIGTTRSSLAPAPRPSFSGLCPCSGDPSTVLSPSATKALVPPVAPPPAAATAAGNATAPRPEDRGTGIGSDFGTGTRSAAATTAPLSLTVATSGSGRIGQSGAAGLLSPNTREVGSAPVPRTSSASVGPGTGSAGSATDGSSASEAGGSTTAVAGSTARISSAGGTHEAEVALAEVAGDASGSSSGDDGMHSASASPPTRAHAAGSGMGSFAEEAAATADVVGPDGAPWPLTTVEEEGSSAKPAAELDPQDSDASHAAVDTAHLPEEFPPVIATASSNEEPDGASIPLTPPIVATPSAATAMASEDGAAHEQPTAAEPAASDTAATADEASPAIAAPVEAGSDSARSLVEPPTPADFESGAAVPLTGTLPPGRSPGHRSHRALHSAGGPGRGMPPFRGHPLSHRGAHSSRGHLPGMGGSPRSAADSRGGSKGAGSGSTE